MSLGRIIRKIELTTSGQPRYEDVVPLDLLRLYEQKHLENRQKLIRKMRKREVDGVLFSIIWMTVTKQEQNQRCCLSEKRSFKQTLLTNYTIHHATNAKRLSGFVLCQEIAQSSATKVMAWFRSCVWRLAEVPSTDKHVLKHLIWTESPR